MTLMDLQMPGLNGMKACPPHAYICKTEGTNLSVGGDAGMSNAAWIHCLSRCYRGMTLTDRHCRENLMRQKESEEHKLVAGDKPHFGDKRCEKARCL